jgi:hypothetical protein
MFCDGGRTSLQEHFSRVFEAAKFQTVTRSLTLVYDEDSAMKLDQEKQKQMLFGGSSEPNGYMSVAQVETVVMKGVTEQPSSGLRKNKHHDGTSSGTALSKVMLTPLSERWAVPHHNKQRMLKTGGVASTGGCSQSILRDDAADEVVNPEAMSKVLVEELLFRSKAVLFVHLTAKDDLCALAAIESKVPYVAITDSEEHTVCLQKHLEEEMFKLFLDEKSRFFKSDLAKSLKQKPASKKRGTPEVGDGGDASVPKKNKAAAAKSEPKAAAKKAASKKAASKKAKAAPKPKAETKTKKKKNATKKGDDEQSLESEEPDEMDEEEEEEEEEPEDEED